MLYRSLGETGLQVSVLSFGAAPLGGVYGVIDESGGVAALRTAFDLGINLIDVSPYYGLTRAETVLGQSLKGIDRSSYILATKVGRYGLDEFDFSGRRVIASVDESLARLGTDHVDVIQCHDIEFGDVAQVIDETIPALETLKQAGKVRFIGVTGYPLAPLARVSEQHHIDSILTYCRYNLLDTTLTQWLPTFAERGVGIINASPLSMGLLTPSGPPDWHPASAEIRAACADAARFCAENSLNVVKLALQFAVANPDIASTLVGMSDRQTVEQNVGWALEEPDPDAIDALRRRLAVLSDPTWPSGRPENADPAPALAGSQTPEEHLPPT